MSAPPHSPVVSRHRQIIDTLGREILSGSLSGALPVEHDLAQRFAVGRGVVREAVKALEAKGLLTVGPRVGTRTRGPAEWNRLDPDVLRWWWDVDPDAVAGHLHELRLLLEPAAAAGAARRGGHEEVARLRDLAEGLADPDPDRALAADLDFHRVLLAASGNPLLGAIGAAFRDVLLPVLECSGADARRRDATAVHRRLAAAVAAGDPDAARGAAETLLGIAHRDYAEVRSES